MTERTTTTTAAAAHIASVDETQAAMVDPGDHGIANLEIQCNSSVDIGEANHHPSLGNPAQSNDDAAIAFDTNNALNDPAATSGLSPSTPKLPSVVALNAKQITGTGSSEFQSHRLPSTTSTESTTTTTATSDCFVSVSSSSINVSNTLINNEMGTVDDPQEGNNQVLTIATFMDLPTKTLALETNDSSATPAAAEPLGQSMSNPPQLLTETTITVDGNETKEGIKETAAAAKQDTGADQANVTGQQEGQNEDQLLQPLQEGEAKEKQEGKSSKDDTSVDTPPIPLEVSSHVNQDHSEYDEELEFDASDDSSEGQLSSDDEEDYIIDPNYFQMGENEPVIIIGVPSMQDTEPSQ